ncbi:hypothetical protein Acr_01g0013010 [Actinidia rufa]|uniref:Uncharacterized protein n=1 Tax=Actinidia rufa TaxID=165716 RepID=A0A7J0E5G0_9ERIC|nr:hypothetical protein Acr_01g0013010 [Actinidia rufa]
MQLGIKRARAKLRCTGSNWVAKMCNQQNWDDEIATLLAGGGSNTSTREEKMVNKHHCCDPKLEKSSAMQKMEFGAAQAEGRGISKLDWFPERSFTHGLKAFTLNISTAGQGMFLSQ